MVGPIISPHSRLLAVRANAFLGGAKLQIDLALNAQLGESADRHLHAIKQEIDQAQDEVLKIVGVTPSVTVDDSKVKAERARLAAKRCGP
jgi:hypothetical protein